jgi:dihydroorotate dehydrogenase
VPHPIPQTEAVVPGAWDFCGLPVGSPLGIAAGPLLNGGWILYYAALGFDVLTYKTVRSRERASYGMPNLQPVEAFEVHDDLQTLAAAPQMRGSWAVSFGMPSQAPDVWRADIEKTRLALPKQKILSVSVVATPDSVWSLTDIAEDFARCARWAVESGADCIEANFSCPNVASADGQLYQHPEAAAEVAAKIRGAIGAKPLLIKIVHVTDKSLASVLTEALARHVNALVMVNCISAKVMQPDRQPLFGGQKRGIAGDAIREAALNQIRLFAEVTSEHHLNMRLVGVGGIATAEQVVSYLNAGSRTVQLATSAMLNPRIGLEIREKLAPILAPTLPQPNPKFSSSTTEAQRHEDGEEGQSSGF